MSDTATPALHIAWVPFQRRQVSMAPLAGFDCVFLPLPSGSSSRLAKAWAYAGHFFRTVALLRRRRPNTVWVQLPQVPLLWAAMVYRLLFAPRAKIVADCHNAMFRPPWSRVPGGLGLFKRCDLVLVHNEAVLETARGLGVPAERLLVLEDVPPVAAPDLPAEPTTAFTGRPRPWILFPGSFSADEPVQALLQAARLISDGTIVMTGRTSNAVRHGHDLSNVPPNVVLPGYLAVDRFNALLSQCDLVLALTRFDGIQLSVCNEAIGYGKPMVLSDTKLLRALFSEAAVMVESEKPESLTKAIADAAARAAQLGEASRRLALVRRASWREGQFARVQRKIQSI